MAVDVDRLIPPRPAWMADAACRYHPEVDFFPGRGGSARPALAVCRDCVVWERCLTYAQENGECGIWGGQVSKGPERRGRRRLKADMKARACRSWCALRPPARAVSHGHCPPMSPASRPTAMYRQSRRVPLRSACDDRVAVHRVRGRGCDQRLGAIALRSATPPAHARACAVRHATVPPEVAAALREPVLLDTPVAARIRARHTDEGDQLACDEEELEELLGHSRRRRTTRPTVAARNGSIRHSRCHPASRSGRPNLESRRRAAEDVSRSGSGRLLAQVLVVHPRQHAWDL